jgi:hypothetical protein
MSNLSPSGYPSRRFAEGGPSYTPLMVPSSFSEATYFWLTFSGLDSVSKRNFSLNTHRLLLSNVRKTLPLTWRGQLSRHCMVPSLMSSSWAAWWTLVYSWRHEWCLISRGYRLKVPLSVAFNGVCDGFVLVTLRGLLLRLHGLF